MHVIDRIYDQNVGYWEANLQSLPHPGRMDRDEVLVDYLGVSEPQIVSAADRLAADGRYALAAGTDRSRCAKSPNSEALKHAKRFTLSEIDGKNQNTDLFKFIIYSAKIGGQTPQLNG